jgi:flagellar protein FlaJ
MNEYGEVSREASKIANRTELMGMDIFSAIEEVARKSPSVEWQKFLQGAVTASAAGARLKPYFVNKAMEYQNMLRVSLKKNSESVSVFAETYVTIGVAFPLFLIVILAVMSVIARNASGATISFLLVFSFLVLPVMIAAFVLVISSVNKEVNIS